MQTPENIVGALGVLAQHKMPPVPPITDDQKMLVEYLSLVRQVTTDAIEYIGLLETEIKQLKAKKQRKPK